jgi:hypothetical protein
MSQNIRDKKRKSSIGNLNICKGLKLWPHQEEALQLVKRYVGNYDKSDPRTMLVQMPAAAGKTAAAVISHSFSDVAVILVIVPPGCRKRTAHREISEIFWKTLPMERPLGKKIILVDKKDIDTYKNDLEGNTVFLCTLSQFCDIAGEKRYREFFDALKNHLSAVILDSGNLLLPKGRAVISDIIKLRKPTVLLKETLFCDDFLRFNVDPSYTFCLTAGEKALFAPLKFENTGTPGDINRFIESVLETLKKEFNGNSFPADFRLQVHCGLDDDVEMMTTSLSDKKINAVGVHPAFKKEKKKPPLYPDIGSTEEVKANVWVLSHHHIEEHQLKYHSMALYSPLHDNEVLVRQLSRISRKGCQTGHLEWSHVFFTDENDVDEFWERYRTYEDGINSAVSELIRELNRELEQGKTANEGIEQFKISLKKKELEVDIRGGTLKKKFNIYEPEAYKKINLRYSGIIFPFAKDIKVTVKKE